MRKLIYLLPLILLLGCTSNSPTGDIIKDSCTGTTCEIELNDYYKIPINEITTTTKFYSYGYGDKQINFFAVLGSDGEIRTAFDACDVCGGRKGYRQSGTDMICNNCGRHFRIDSLGTKNKGGGCWPSHLEHKTQGDYVLIKKSDLINGARFF